MLHNDIEGDYMKEAKKDKRKLSFEEYFNEYYRQALGFVNNKINDIHTAEDITMDAFASCYKNFERFDPKKASFATWLYVVLGNKIKNYYRDKKIFSEIDELTLIDSDMEDDVAQAIYISSMRDNLYMALKELNEIQRQIVICKFFHGKNAVEIAELTGLSHANVRVQLSRALQKLRKFFEINNIRWE